MSSSTATTRFVAFPLLLSLNRPMNWLAKAPGRPFVGEITKAMPWPLRVAYSETMAKTKVVEKDETVPFGDGLSFTGEEKKACPVFCLVSFVSFRRPLEVIPAMPSRLKVAGEWNPL